MEHKNTRADRRAFWGFVILIVLFMLPVFAVALYNRPSADDFGYSLQTHAVAVEYGFSPGRLLRAALDTDIAYFNTWQGLYSSAFLLSLQPAIFGESWYGLTTFLVVGILFLCLWGMLHLVVRGRFSGSRLWAPALALLFTYAFVQGMPNPVEGLFWFNGAMNYLPFFALTLLNAGILFAVSAGCRRPLAWMLLSGLLAVVISGGHQVAALLNLMLTLYAVLYGLFKKRPWALLPFFCGLAGLLVNLNSPGTAVRYAGFSSASMPEAIVKSFVLVLFCLIRWLDVPLLCLLALLTVPAWKLAACHSFRLPRPWVIPAAGFLVLWGMLWLPSYTMGGIGPGRLINVVWMTFVLEISLFYMTEVIRLAQKGFPQTQKAETLLSRHPRRTGAAAAATLICMACIGGHTVKEGLDNHFGTSLEAAYELAEGTPQAYARALDERAGRLSDPGTADVTIRCLTEDEKPYLLYFSDVVPGPDQWGLAEYYGKQSVTVEQP